MEFLHIRPLPLRHLVLYVGVYLLHGPLACRAARLMKLGLDMIDRPERLENCGDVGITFLVPLVLRQDVHLAGAKSVEIPFDQ